MSADSPSSEIRDYEAPDGGARLEVGLDHDTVWLMQDQLSRLFGRERSVVTRHVRNVFREGELDAKSVCAEFAQGEPAAERGDYGQVVPAQSLRSAPTRLTEFASTPVGSA